MKNSFNKQVEKNFGKDLYTLSYGLKKQLQKKILTTIFYIFIVVLITVAILSFLIFPVSVKSNSMNPDIPSKSIVLMTPLKFDIDRGDVYLIDKDCNIDTIYKKALDAFMRFVTLQKVNLHGKSDNISSKMSLRRVVGLPGDTVYIKDYMVYVKPRGEKYFLTEFEVSDKSYNIEINNINSTWDDEVGINPNFAPVTLGVNQYFVLADNRFSCLDTRYWGVVQKEDLYSKALALYWPVKKAKLF